MIIHHGHLQELKFHIYGTDGLRISESPMTADEINDYFEDMSLGAAGNFIISYPSDDADKLIVATGDEFLGLSRGWTKWYQGEVCND